jgi:hypothetical protein
VPCIDVQWTLWRLGLSLAALLLAACAAPPVSPLATAAREAPAVKAAPAGAVAAATPVPVSQSGRSSPAAEAAAAEPQARSRAPRFVNLPAPVTPRNTTELRQQFAQRLVAAHPDTSYISRPPDRLWAIPVLEIELNADGSVRKIDVLRKPSTGSEATALAIAAINRAAPYGNVSRLPKPWKIVETFLFDDDLRFKPRTLDMK